MLNYLNLYLYLIYLKNVNYLNFADLLEDVKLSKFISDLLEDVKLSKLISNWLKLKCKLSKLISDLLRC